MASSSSTSSSSSDPAATLNALSAFPMDLPSLIQDKKVDFGRRSDDYARHRPGFPDSFYDRVLYLFRQAQQGKRVVETPLGTDGVTVRDYTAPAAETLDRNKPLRILDLGCGPGIVGLRMAQLYPQAEIVGVDYSENQVDMARQRAVELGLADRTSWLASSAHETKQADASFDIAIAGTAWHWFDHEKTMAEMRRVLKPNGLLVIADLIYLSSRSPMAEESDRLVLKFNPEWRMAGLEGLHSHYIPMLVNQGRFELAECFAYDVEYIVSHTAWRGRMRTCNGVGTSHLSDEVFRMWDQEFTKLLQEKFPDPCPVWHRIFAVAATNRTW